MMCHALTWNQIKERPNALAVREINSSIKFNNVSFDYSACEQAFTVIPKRSAYASSVPIASDLGTAQCWPTSASRQVYKHR